MQNVLITGASKGIGQAITKIFNENDFHITVVARDFSSFEIKNPSIRKVEFDLCNTNGIPELAKEVGNIDILINNAGMMNASPYNDYPEDKKKAIIALNIEAPVALIKELTPHMIQKGRGAIVSTASIAGEIGHPDVWYGITKAGIINMTKSFAKLLGPKGITVNCVAPGPVEDTPMFSVIPQERKDQIKQAVISGRFAKPEEIAKTVYWLAVDAPKYINGICIDVNNGAFLR